MSIVGYCIRDCCNCCGFDR